MSVRIVIAGEIQCEMFAESCLIADHLDRCLPEFCYERIELPVIEWGNWLMKVNVKNGWHHVGSPIVWKECFIKGSKPFYIGGASEFMEYCHSYYYLDMYISNEKFEGLAENYQQFKRNVKLDSVMVKQKLQDFEEPTAKTNFVICISGASCPLARNVINALLEFSQFNKTITKIYIYDEKCSEDFMHYVEEECSYTGTKHPGRVVKFVDKIGMAINHADVMVIMDHVPFEEDKPIGTWLYENNRLMQHLALMVNAAACRTIQIIFPSLGPACYNATVLMHNVTSTAIKRNIVVATNNIALGLASAISEVSGVPFNDTFAAPVWGFVGINHLADVRTTLYRYNRFEPYSRYAKVLNSTLQIGRLTPDIRTLEHLFHFDDTLWMKVTEMDSCMKKEYIDFNVGTAVQGLIKMWLFDPNPDEIINLGIPCDGTFGLTFDGIFSQPAKWNGSEWVPAAEFMLPKDPVMKLSYMQDIANTVMKLKPKELPPIIPDKFCTCKMRYYYKPIKQKKKYKPPSLLNFAGADTRGGP